MTTSVRQPTLVDSGIAQIVEIAAKTLMQVPPDGATIVHCDCAYSCTHIRVWLPVVLVDSGPMTGLSCWARICLAGCEPGPNQHGV